MTNKEAKELYNMLSSKSFATLQYYVDSTRKSFLLLKKKAENQLEFYKNHRLKGISQEAQEEIIRIINSWQLAIDTELDIITNGANAKCFKTNLSIDNIKSGEYFKGGFGGGTEI